MTISACIVAHDERDMLPGCLDSLAWADEIVVVVSAASTDGTAELARARTPHVHVHEFENFAEQRNFACAQCSGDWVLFVDADERIPGRLRDEIRRSTVSAGALVGYSIPSRNIFLGREMHHGGWAPDAHLRLFRRDRFREYVNVLHEVPRVDGPCGRLTEGIVHLSHRSIIGMVAKTAAYLAVEKQQTPVRRIGVLDFFRVIVRDFGYRGVLRQGFRDGTVGWIEMLYQPFSRFLSMAQAWESQHRDEIEAAYRKWDRGERP